MSYYYSSGLAPKFYEKLNLTSLKNYKKYFESKNSEPYTPLTYSNLEYDLCNLIVVIDDKFRSYEEAY